ncbi:hypothetical protein Fmac_014752 [Flemingia macrophylla]|uniref:Uncharacterized protein n=1 Tax=Flemingia macrophylla TaxID=520843 RepID=A0ABD1MCN5_9FABA
MDTTLLEASVEIFRRQALESRALLLSKEEIMKEVLSKTPKWKPKLETVKLTNGEVASEKEKADRYLAKVLNIGRSLVKMLKARSFSAPIAPGSRKERWRLAIARKKSSIELG